VEFVRAPKVVLHKLQFFLELLHGGVCGAVSNTPIAIATYATSRYTFANTQMIDQNLKHTLTTYTYSHCNKCNTRSTFATPDETLATYA
jgi:hypothetical protein